MATSRNVKIVRTYDDLRFEVETDERYLSNFPEGELVQSRSGVGDFISHVSQALVSGIEQSQADTAQIEFAVTMSAVGTFVIASGRDAAHVVVRLEFTRQSNAAS